MDGDSFIKYSRTLSILLLGGLIKIFGEDNVIDKGTHPLIVLIALVGFLLAKKMEKWS